MKKITSVVFGFVLLLTACTPTEKPAEEKGLTYQDSDYRYSIELPEISEAVVHDSLLGGTMIDFGGLAHVMIQAYPKDDQKLAEFENGEKIEINGLQASQISGHGVLGPYAITMILEGDYVYQLSFSSENGEQKFMDAQDQLVNSFQLLFKDEPVVAEPQSGLYQIQNVALTDGSMNLTVKKLQWFGYEEGIEAAMEDTGCPREKITWGDCAPSLNNGVYVRVSDQEEVFSVQSNANIETFAPGSSEYFKHMTLSEFYDHWNAYDEDSPPYHLALEEGVVTGIVEQYVP